MMDITFSIYECDLCVESATGPDILCEKCRGWIAKQEAKLDAKTDPR